MRIFADTGVSVAYCPCTRINYASARRLPVIDLLDAGATVTIATDAPAPDRTLDLFKDLRVAMILQRYAYVDAAMLPEGKALEMVTIDAARALGREHDLGSLEVGKKADVITVGLQAPHLVPRLTLPLRIAYEATATTCRTSW